jgi:hypothetical protein
MCLSIACVDAMAAPLTNEPIAQVFDESEKVAFVHDRPA